MAGWPAGGGPTTPMAATIESTANAMSVISITNTVGQNAAWRAT